MIIRITPRVKVGLIVGLVFIVAFSYLINKFTQPTISQKGNQSSSGHESVDEYNKRKREEALRESNEKDNRKSNEKIDPDYGKELTMDGWDPASQTAIDPINLWTNYENRTYAGKVHHGEKVWYVKREGDGVLIETKSGNRGWVTYFFIKEFKKDKK